MESERIFSADQIVVHPDLAKIIRDYTKAAIRAAPNGEARILEFSQEYFARQMALDDGKRAAQLASAPATTEEEEA